MAASQELALERLHEAFIDGRTENVRYRQDQLQSLHKALREDAAAICSALAKDSQSTTAEVETEYYLAMDAVRHFYDGLDFTKELEQEYSVANGSNNEHRRVGAGMVIIRPTSHTRFYSIVTPLAAAMAAGNCIILELADTLLQLDSVLRGLLPKILDMNTFCISKAISDKATLDAAVLVDQTSSKSANASRFQLLSSVGTRAVAIVDRTADIDLAAKAITTARFSFGGSSPYAPDLVLVNEYVKQQFFEACSKYATLAFAKESSVKKISGNLSEESKKSIKAAEDKRQVSSFGSSDFKLVDILDRNTPIMNMKISGRYLPIATCSSLVDAIFTHEFENPLLAGYFFADPKAAKYLSQHLPCHISCVNQIPVQLLVGPAAPIAHEPNFLYRYSKDMFSSARPQFAEPLPESFQKAEELLAGSKGSSTSKLRILAVKPLKPTGQPKNEIMGFFETGFVIGASITLTVVLPMVSYATWTLGRKGIDYLQRFRRGG